MATSRTAPSRLQHRAPQLLSPYRSNISRSASGTKRPRSPEAQGDDNPPCIISKRAREAPASPCHRELDKEARRTQREAQKEEFRVKYTKAFPSWTFYFDMDGRDPSISSVRKSLEDRVAHLGGLIDDFFSNEVTHLITNQQIMDGAAEKENHPKSRVAQTRQAPAQTNSPSRSRVRQNDETGQALGQDSLVKKAQAFGMKIWSVEKLESVLERLIVIPTSAAAIPVASLPQRRSLNRLLQSERLHGTSERDPSQKRHDFRYFARSSYFVLVEDMKQELATIAAHEYSSVKGRDGQIKPSWPVLHCHPQSRGPFIAFDEKEKKRWEKAQAHEREIERKSNHKRQLDLRRQERKKAEECIQTTKGGDLRRSVSMSNLHRRLAHERVDGEYDGETPCALDSANASGYLASGTGTYVAASGNSVGITSTTGTTSMASQSLRNLQLPAALQGRMQQQVIMSRAGGVSRARTSSLMGPPAEKHSRLLRKSKSTNTIRLPKREEGCKPGYCESCRTKFEDFKAHIDGRRHRKFADDDSNFLQLDYVLARVRRRTLAEVEQDRERQHSWRLQTLYASASDSDTESSYLPVFGPDGARIVDKEDADSEMLS